MPKTDGEEEKLKRKKPYQILIGFLMEEMILSNF